RFAWLALVFALGLMAKPMMVSLPAVLVLLDLWPLGRIRDRATLWRSIREKALLFGLAVASSVVTFIVQRRSGAVVTMEDVPLAHRLANAVVSYGRYLAKLAWPAGLTPYYPNLGAVPGAEVAGVAIGLALVTWIAVRQRKTMPWLLTGWLWYLGMLIPVIGI